MAKVSSQFQQVIEQYLKHRGFEDPLFAETLKKKNKSLEECCNYIINTVQKSGKNGFPDDEIFGMAVHYYDEDNITAEKASNVKIVVNKEVELTKEEIEKAKKEAFEAEVKEQREKVRTSPEIRLALADIKLTDEELKEAKALAIQNVIDQKKEEMLKKPKSSNESKEQSQNLFNL